MVDPALARANAVKGARVGIRFHSGRKAAETLASYTAAAGSKAHFVSGVPDTSTATGAIDRSAEWFGRLDSRVSIAGLMLERVAFKAVNDGQTVAVVDQNACIGLTATRVMRSSLRRNGGFIIAKISADARERRACGATSCRTLRSLISILARGLAKVLVGDLTSEDAISPSIVNTAFRDGYPAGFRLEAMRQTIPIGSWG